ncbi:MAG: hypothetical protein RLZZ234_815 [Candidatus Parcubacteria bacterium]|jgi:hypothetical protein
MKSFLLSIFLASLFLVPAASVSADNGIGHAYAYGHYKQSAYSSATLESLFRQLATLQAELVRLQGYQTGCRTVGNARYCTNYTSGSNNTVGDARSIDVEYRNSAAYVTIEYRNGRGSEYTIGGADSDSEVIDALVDVTDLSRAEIVAVISFDDNNDSNDDSDDDDIDSIEVTLDTFRDEADAIVRFEDGDIDRYSFDTDNKDEIIEELSDELDIDEDDVEDLIEWEYENNSSYDIDDIETIDADVDEDDNRTEVWVEFENGTTRHYIYSTDDEDEVIERLSDDLDIDEDDIEDIINFDYVD